MSKHQLLISIGPSYDLTEHTTIVPNDDSQPCLVDTPNFTGRICVRILDYKGLTPPGTTRLESSPYFNKRRERYSIQAQGRFKGNWTGDDIVFGNNFDRRILLPPGSWLGLKILQCIDAGLEGDIYSDKPWAFSPLIYTMNKLRNEEYDKDGGLPPWPSPRGEHIEENMNIDGVKFNDDSKRKKYFVSKENRKKIQIKDDQIWNFDFFNSYMDFNEVAVTLPGFKFPMLQYWDGQPIRYVCKTRDSSVIFFVILFQLIPIDQKEDSLNSDISNLTPKTGARWASLKSPSSFLTKSKKGISLSPSPTPSTTSNSDDDADPKRSK